MWIGRNERLRTRTLEFSMAIAPGTYPKGDARSRPAPDERRRERALHDLVVTGQERPCVEQQRLLLQPAEHGDLARAQGRGQPVHPPGRAQRPVEGGDPELVESQRAEQRILAQRRDPLAPPEHDPRLRTAE